MYVSYMVKKDGHITYYFEHPEILFFQRKKRLFINVVLKMYPEYFESNQWSLTIRLVFVPDER